MCAEDVAASQDLEHGVVHARHSSAGDIGTYVQALQGGQLAELGTQKLRVALWRVSAMVLEAVEVLVSLATHLASVGLLLLHADSAGIGYRGERVDDGESSVLVLL